MKYLKAISDFIGTIGSLDKILIPLGGVVGLLFSASIVVDFLSLNWAIFAFVFFSIALNYLYFVRLRTILSYREEAISTDKGFLDAEKAEISKENKELREEVFRFGRIELDAAHRALCGIHAFLQALQIVTPLKVFRLRLDVFFINFEEPISETWFVMSDQDLIGEHIFNARWQEKISLSTVDAFLFKYFDDNYFAVESQLNELVGLDYYSATKQFCGLQLKELELLYESPFFEHQADTFLNLLQKWREANGDMKAKLRLLVRENGLPQTYKAYRAIS